MKRAAPVPVLLAVALELALAAQAAGLRAAEGKSDRDEPKPGVTIENAEGGKVLEAVLPGRLRGYALPRRADGHRDVILLVAPPPPNMPTARVWTTLEEEFELPAAS